MSLVCHYYNDCNLFAGNLKIKMPKKEKLNENITRPMEIKGHVSYELNNKSECFDPNVSASPSNVFITTLQNRMDKYYADAILISLHRRERANSMEIFIRKHD
jgi:hypothetical protein